MSHSHSLCATRLRLGVLECEEYFKLNTSYLTAWAAIASHANLDVKASIRGFEKLYKDVRNTIPFMRYDTARGGTDIEQLVEQYKKMTEDAAKQKSETVNASTT